MLLDAIVHILCRVKATITISATHEGCGFTARHDPNKDGRLASDESSPEMAQSCGDLLSLRTSVRPGKLNALPPESSAQDSRTMEQAEVLR